MQTDLSRSTSIIAIGNPTGKRSIAAMRTPIRVNRYSFFAAEQDTKSVLIQKTDLIPISNPLVALRGLRSEPSFTLELVQSGCVPKAIEFFFDRPADVPSA